ncbi:enolase C-terminal domain-like protein [Streptosporangium sp. NPDC001559]|uniref:DNA topoisomerase IB n=1 Tax=Streptosporangium sp. NPDC001559 TaxID=3366187 RepID=UPI0036E9CE56
MKLKTGRDRDVRPVRRAREAIGAEAELYVDANGAYTAKEAIRLAAEPEEWDVRWFEEPVSSDDLSGLRRVREAVRAGVTRRASPNENRSRGSGNGMHELRHSDPAEPGITRRRRGRSFSYAYADGRPVRDRGTLARIRALALPPAWREVWICRDAKGHIQAVGTDAAGRRQYRYHDVWREEQDRLKFARVAELAERLPDFRKKVQADLDQPGLTRERVLAAAARMLDIGLFRVGGEAYESFGLATMRMEHVTCSRGRVAFRYPAKSGRLREIELDDPDVCEVVTALRGTGAKGELLRYEDDGSWVDVRSDDINAYLRERMETEVSAKDFRTWHATVYAAVGLAVSRRVRSRAGRRRAVARVMREVAGHLGNTPAVARASYVDPRVVTAYERGRTIHRALTDLGEADGPATHGAAERAVIDLLKHP